MDERLPWKLYYVFIILAMGYGWLFGLYVSPAITLLDMVVSIWAYVALFCYAWRKPFLTPRFWRDYFFINLAWDIFFNFWAAQQVTGTSLKVSSLAGIFFLIPLHVAVFLYAFHGPGSPKRTRKKRS